MPRVVLSTITDSITDGVTVSAASFSDDFDTYSRTHLDDHSSAWWVLPPSMSLNPSGERVLCAVVGDCVPAILAVIDPADDLGEFTDAEIAEACRA